jgi:hypothetical protein
MQTYTWRSCAVGIFRGQGKVQAQYTPVMIAILIIPLKPTSKKPAKPQQTECA